MNKVGIIGNKGKYEKKQCNINPLQKMVKTKNDGKEGNLIDFSQNWEAPVYFDDFNLSEISETVLPSPYKEFSEALSNRLETPKSAAILCILSILATAVQNKFVVQAEADYAEPLNLYIMVGMPPANRKTAILKSCVKPVIDYEKKQRMQLEPEYKKQLSMFYSQKKLIENERKRLTTEKANEGAIEIIAEKEMMLNEPPALPKLFLTDATTESLATALYEQGGKISIITDEGGILDTCSGLYTGGVSNIDVLLKGWDGGNLSIKRRDREVYIAPYITIFMIVQPVIFENMAKNKNFAGKGFYERFLFCEPYSKIGYRTHQGQTIPGEVVRNYECAITELLNIPMPSRPAKIRLSKQALLVWKIFQDKLEKELRKGGKLELCQGWGGKLCGQTLRLAGLLHIARYKGNSVSLNEDTMNDAIAIASCLISHAAKVFDNFILSSDARIKEAQFVWGIIKGFGKLSITQREIVYALRHKMCANQIKELLSILIERNLISEPVKTPGCRTITYFVNPQALENVDEHG